MAVVLLIHTHTHTQGCEPKCPDGVGVVHSFGLIEVFFFFFFCI